MRISQQHVSTWHYFKTNECWIFSCVSIYIFHQIFAKFPLRYSFWCAWQQSVGAVTEKGSVFIYTWSIAHDEIVGVQFAQVCRGYKGPLIPFPQFGGSYPPVSVTTRRRKITTWISWTCSRCMNNQRIWFLFTLDQFHMITSFSVKDEDSSEYFTISKDCTTQGTEFGRRRKQFCGNCSQDVSCRPSASSVVSDLYDRQDLV